MNYRKSRNIVVTAAILGLLATFGVSSATAVTEGPGSPPNSQTAQFGTNRELTVTEARARLAEISSEYTEIGDRLSAEDAEFIKIYAIGGTDETLYSSAGQIKIESQPAATGVRPAGTTAALSFNKSGKGAGGTGNVKGRESTTNGSSGVTTNKWSISYTATGGGTVNKIKAAVHVKAYGFVGASGIGLVYVSDPSSTVKGKKNAFSRSSSYFDLVAYSTIQYDSIFYTPEGSFQVAG